jgi:hypothetical protein
MLATVEFCEFPARRTHLLQRRLSHVLCIFDVGFVGTALFRRDVVAVPADSLARSI